MLQDALRCGVSVIEFWDLTPRETFMSMEGYLWREERRQQAEITAAWLTAKLSRARRVPALKQLLADRRPQRTSAAELARRGEEFEEMSKNIDLEALNRHRKKIP